MVPKAKACIYKTHGGRVRELPGEAIRTKEGRRISDRDKLRRFSKEVAFGMKDLNVRLDSITLLEENIGRTLLT